MYLKKEEYSKHREILNIPQEVVDLLDSLLVTVELLEYKCVRQIEIDNLFNKYVLKHNIYCPEGEFELALSFYKYDNSLEKIWLYYLDSISFHHVSSISTNLLAPIQIVIDKISGGAHDKK